MDVFSLDEELICAVCRDIFVEPVTLPCGHNYCEDCVNKLKRSLRDTEDGEVLTGYYTCPLCLSPCDSRIELKKNVALHNIIEKYQQRRASSIDCSVCKGQQKLAAEKVCLNCEESYCTLHIMPHLENNTLRQHFLVDPIGNIGRLCKEHGKELELYCKTCGIALCVYCMLPAEAKHLNGHSVVKLSDALADLKVDCQAKLRTIQDSLSDVTDSLAKLEEASSLSKERLERQQQQHTAFLSRIKMFLDFEEKAWKQRFSVDLVQENRNVQHQAERLKRLKGRLVHAQEALLTGLSVNNPLMLLQTVKNTDWADLYDGEACKCHIQEVTNWRGPKPITSTNISPFFQIFSKIFADDITLNAASAHSRLCLNAERNAVWVAEGSGITSGSVDSGDLMCVLGDAAFSSGVHNWEVDVGSIPAWSVGISYEVTHCRALCSGLGGDGRSWALSYNHGRRQFCAQHDWLQFCFSHSDAGPLGRVGVFLDVDSGILSFYNVIGLKHLYTFYCNLHSPVYPVFGFSGKSVGGRAQEMKVRNVFFATKADMLSGP